MRITKRGEGDVLTPQLLEPQRLDEFHSKLVESHLSPAFIVPDDFPRVVYITVLITALDTLCYGVRNASSHLQRVDNAVSSRWMDEAAHKGGKGENMRKTIFLKKNNI